MKYSIALVAAGAAFVAAQDVASLPECGVSLLSQHSIARPLEFYAFVAMLNALAMRSISTRPELG
jgi:hypothetical protein